MDIPSTVNEIQQLAGKLPFPAHKQDVVAHATQEGASPTSMNLLQQLPEQNFGSMEEMMQKLPLGKLGGELGKFL